jgi:hypothetical protein
MVLGMRYENKDRLYACHFNQASSPIGAVCHRSDSRLDLICIFRGGRLLCGVIVRNVFSMVE